MNTMRMDHTLANQSWPVFLSWLTLGYLLPVAAFLLVMIHTAGK